MRENAYILTRACHPKKKGYVMEKQKTHSSFKIRTSLTLVSLLSVIYIYSQLKQVIIKYGKTVLFVCSTHRRYKKQSKRLLFVPHPLVGKTRNIRVITVADICNQNSSHTCFYISQEPISLYLTAKSASKISSRFYLPKIRRYSLCLY